MRFAFYLTLGQDLPLTLLMSDIHKRRLYLPRPKSLVIPAPTPPILVYTDRSLLLYCINFLDALAGLTSRHGQN
jgi:hypothetical protein